MILDLSAARRAKSLEIAKRHDAEEHAIQTAYLERASTDEARKWEKRAAKNGGDGRTKKVRAAQERAAKFQEALKRGNDA